LREVVVERIRVAVDGSRVSGHALAWAVEVGRRAGATVEVVTVLGLHGPVFVDRIDEFVEGPEEWWIQDRQRELLEEVAGDTGDLDVRFSMLEGQPAEALIGAEPAADLLVVGTRGVGGFVGLMVGSTAHQLVDHAPSSVAVVPDLDEAPAAPDRVLVGLDGTGTAQEALRWALAELATSGEAVTALRVIGEEQGEARGAGWTELRDAVVADVPEAADVGAWEIAGGRAATRLLARAQDADVLVLGQPGGGENVPLNLGSVAHRCLKTTPVPVVVVR
jgi:nucleotide-binding universal stress UspA family protein